MALSGLIDFHLKLSGGDREEDPAPQPTPDPAAAAQKLAGFLRGKARKDG